MMDAMMWAIAMSPMVGGVLMLVAEARLLRTSHG
jgi:hypothetical protein